MLKIEENRQNLQLSKQAKKGRNKEREKARERQVDERVGKEEKQRYRELGRKYKIRKMKKRRKRANENECSVEKLTRTRKKQWEKLGSLYQLRIIILFTLERLDRVDCWVGTAVILDLKPDANIICTFNGDPTFLLYAMFLNTKLFRYVNVQCFFFILRSFQRSLCIVQPFFPVRTHDFSYYGKQFNM